MKLKFIGKDGSMRLRHGWVYDCSIMTAHGQVWVIWETWGACPYGSLKKLLENWTDEF